MRGFEPATLCFGVISSARAFIPSAAAAVRTGDLGAFNDVLEKFGKAFERDRNYTLILRVRHNVIKAGVRRISTGYSRISLADVASKLQLDSAEDAEFIIAKVSLDPASSPVLSCCHARS